jgi:hypothetical protein
MYLFSLKFENIRVFCSVRQQFYTAGINSYEGNGIVMVEYL